jgi:hypothetical protein
MIPGYPDMLVSSAAARGPACIFMEGMFSLQSHSGVHKCLTAQLQTQWKDKTCPART